MAQPSSTALTKRSQDTALMPPPPPPKRQKRPNNVLDEDVYADALSHIIARDFFPGLLETEAQQAYMEALDSKNNDWIREAGRKLTQVMTPGPDGRRLRRGTAFTPRRSTALSETPRGYAGDTPGQTPRNDINDDFAPETKPDVDVNMSLGAFQTKYTSEDNESFNALLDKQNEKKAAKYGFFHHGNNIPSTRQIAHRAREQRLLENGATSSTALIVTNAAGEERKTLASTGGPSEDLDARPASVDSFTNRQGPRNNFMFDPEGVEDTTVTVAQQAQQRSNAPPKSVTYDATRFPSTSTTADASSVPPSPSLSAIDAAIAGRPKPTDSESGYTGAETPRINGYAFVDAEPTPSELGVPVTDEEADAAEREAVLRLLPKPEEGGPNPFKLHEQSKREDLHSRLAERADAGRRKEKGGTRLYQLRRLGVTPGSTSGTPRPASASNKDAIGGMTPAAQRLAGMIGGIPDRRREVFGGRSEGGRIPPRTPVGKVEREI